MRIPIAHVRRAWADTATPTEVSARALGITRHRLSDMARCIGLPPRRPGPKPRVSDGDEFAAMWAAGVGTGEIMRHYGWKRRSGPFVMARLLGLPPRPHGRSHHSITVAEFRERQIALRMAEAASVTRCALRDAGMTDNPAGNWRVP